MVNVVPVVDPDWLGLVRDINQCYRYLYEIVPGGKIWISVAGVYNLVLNNHVFACVKFDVLDVKHLSIWIAVPTYLAHIVRVRDINDTHLIPACLVGVGAPIRRFGDLNFGVVKIGVEVNILDIVGVKLVFRRIAVVMFLIL